MSEVVFETPRLLARPWNESDAAVLFLYASDPDVGERLPTLVRKKA